VEGVHCRYSIKSQPECSIVHGKANLSLLWLSAAEGQLNSLVDLRRHNLDDVCESFTPPCPTKNVEGFLDVS
jgi:hypothetical protein